ERINSIRKLIADIIDLTKLESGRKKRNIETFDIKDLITRTAEGFSNYAAKRNIKINLSCESFYIKADQTDMEMLVSNFLSNAIKYNRDGGSVNIEVKR
ncbi:MAG: hypothetical protein N2Z60_05155, partial [Elusimicrobiales bacterium]|nr:hypothetical protein [Elusimicrobiales bacterium]